VPHAPERLPPHRERGAFLGARHVPRRQKSGDSGDNEVRARNDRGRRGQRHEAQQLGDRGDVRADKRRRGKQGRGDCPDQANDGAAGLRVQAETFRPGRRFDELNRADAQRNILPNRKPATAAISMALIGCSFTRSDTASTFSRATL
jgi:hypothetical protein